MYDTMQNEVRGLRLAEQDRIWAGEDARDMSPAAAEAAARQAVRVLRDSIEGELPCGDLSLEVLEHFAGSVRRFDQARERLQSLYWQLGTDDLLAGMAVLEKAANLLADIIGDEWDWEHDCPC